MELKHRTARLFEEFQRGESQSFEKLVHEVHDILARYSFRVTRDREEALDITQEALIRLFNQSDRIQSPQTVLAWLFTITKNMSIDSLRRRKTRRNLMERLRSESHPANKSEPLDELGVQEIRECMDCLPQAAQDILYMSMEPDLSHEDIAAVLSIPVGTVKSRLFHARRRLKETLRERGYVEEYR